MALHLVTNIAENISSKFTVHWKYPACPCTELLAPN